MLTVDGQEYMYFSLVQLIAGIMVHALGGLMSAVEVSSIVPDGTIFDCIKYLPEICMKLNYNIRFFNWYESKNSIVNSRRCK